MQSRLLKLVLILHFLIAGHPTMEDPQAAAAADTECEPLPPQKAEQAEASQKQLNDPSATADAPGKTSSGTSQQQPSSNPKQQEASTTQDLLLQSALALFMPNQQMPNVKNVAKAADSTAAGMATAGSLPGLPHLADSRELQLVAAAFAAGAAAGAAGQLNGSLPLLEQFSSGDTSNTGYAMDSAAHAAGYMDHATAAAQQAGSKLKPAAAKANSKGAYNTKSTYR